MVPGGLRGSLERLSLADLLRELQAANATGILSLSADAARKALYFKAGRVVFASSNQLGDRLGEILVRAGRITQAQSDASTRDLGHGRRQGRVLVEQGVLTPEQLWEAVQTQVREIVWSVIAWDQGRFHFEPSVLPERERITVDLDVTSLIVEGARRLAPAVIPRHRTDPQAILERGESPPEGLLHPWEEHVLQLVDGQRSVLEICQESEAGEGQTLKALFAFLGTGLVLVAGRRERPLDDSEVPSESLRAVLEAFNRKYRFVCAAMVREVGPIAENVLTKYLRNVREGHPDVLADVALGHDGALEEAGIERNLARLSEERRRAALVTALNELLYAELLAVKRTLGADHETSIVRSLQASA